MSGVQMYHYSMWLYIYIPIMCCVRKLFDLRSEAEIQKFWCRSKNRQPMLPIQPVTYFCKCTFLGTWPTQLFIYCLWLLSCYKVELSDSNGGPMSSIAKILTIWSFTETLIDPCCNVWETGLFRLEISHLNQILCISIKEKICKY